MYTIQREVVSQYKNNQSFAENFENSEKGITDLYKGHSDIDKPQAKSRSSLSQKSAQQDKLMISSTVQIEVVNEKDNTRVL